MTLMTPELSSAAFVLALFAACRHLVEPTFQLAEQHVALFQRVALAPFEQARKARRNAARCRKRSASASVHAGVRSILFGNRGDLAGESLDCFVRQRVVRAPFRRRAPTACCRRLITSSLGRSSMNFLDLPCQRRDARLDALERLGIEMRGLRGDRGADDGAGNLVEPLLDLSEGLRIAAACCR